MRRPVSVLIISLLIFYICGCNSKEREVSRLVKSNGLILNNISLKNLKDGRMDMSLVAAVLEYDRERGTIEIDDGVVVRQMRFSSGTEDVRIRFRKGIYDLSSETINMSSLDGILLDHNIMMNLSDLTLCGRTGQIRSGGMVFLKGRNFEFVGEGFSGSIRDGTYYFTDGITARIFKL